MTRRLLLGASTLAAAIAASLLATAVKRRPIRRARPSTIKRKYRPKQIGRAGKKYTLKGIRP